MKYLTLLLAGLVVLASCSQAPKEDAKLNQDVQEDNVLGASADDIMVLNAYLELKDALVQSSQENANLASASMVAMIGGIGNNAELISIQEKADKIAKAEELEAQRVAFEALSTDVYEYCKSKPCGKTLYKQYCPMAFDHKGAAWLSDKEEIRNPYFGKVMLKCGKIEETL